MYAFPLGQCVSDFEYAVVWQSYDVASPCFIDGRLALRHELGGRGESQCLALAYMQIRLITQESS